MIIFEGRGGALVDLRDFKTIAQEIIEVGITCRCFARLLQSVFFVSEP